MRKIAVAAVLSALAVPAFIAPALADRDPTEEERARIEEVLRANGFTEWEDIEFEDDGLWEVDDATTADGQEFDLKLDTALEIVERDED